MELGKRIDEIQAEKKKNEFVEQLRAKVKQAENAAENFNSNIEALFKNFPSLVAFGWRQGTPAWNDGDVCEFYVTDPFFLFEELLNEEGELCDDEDGCVWSINSIIKNEPEKAPFSWNLTTLSNFCENFADCEDFLQFLFGDGQRVLVKRDGTVELEEWEVW